MFLAPFSFPANNVSDRTSPHRSGIESITSSIEICAVEKAEKGHQAILGHRLEDGSSGRNRQSFVRFRLGDLPAVIRKFSRLVNLLLEERSRDLDEKNEPFSLCKRTCCCVPNEREKNPERMRGSRERLGIQPRAPRNERLRFSWLAFSSQVEYCLNAYRSTDSAHEKYGGIADVTDNGIRYFQQKYVS